MVASTEQEKSFTAQNAGSTWPEDIVRRQFFSEPICAKEERNGPPSANQGLSTAKPRSSHAFCTLQVHPPTSPCPTVFAGAEPKSQGHCWR